MTLPERGIKRSDQANLTDQYLLLSFHFIQVWYSCTMRSMNTAKLVAQYAVFVIICLGCDRIISAAKSTNLRFIVSNSRIIFSIMDSFSHGIIAFHAWLLSVEFVLTSRNIGYAFLCTIIACSVDVDHFLAAGSWKLNVSLLSSLICNLRNPWLG